MTIDLPRNLYGQTAARRHTHEGDINQFLITFKKSFFRHSLGANQSQNEHLYSWLDTNDFIS